MFSVSRVLKRHVHESLKATDISPDEIAKVQSTLSFSPKLWTRRVRFTYGNSAKEFGSIETNQTNFRDPHALEHWIRITRERVIEGNHVSLEPWDEVKAALFSFQTSKAFVKK